jgi:hypothetical protein
MGVAGLFPEDRWIILAEIGEICRAKLETDFYKSKHFTDFFGMILDRNEEV